MSESGNVSLPTEFARELVEMVGDFLCLCRFGVITWVNTAGAAMMGCPSAQDLHGYRFDKLLHPDHAVALHVGLHSLAEIPDGQPPTKTGGCCNTWWCFRTSPSASSTRNVSAVRPATTR